MAHSVHCLNTGHFVNNRSSKNELNENQDTQCMYIAYTRYGRPDIYEGHCAIIRCIFF